MNWLSFAILLLKMASQIVQYLHDRKTLDAGGAQKIADILENQKHDLAKILHEIDEAGKRFDDVVRAGGMPSDIRFRD
jgi:hypothetical protein